MLTSLVVAVHAECLRHQLGQPLLVAIQYTLPGVLKRSDIAVVMGTGIVDKVTSYVPRT